MVMAWWRISFLPNSTNEIDAIGATIYFYSWGATQEIYLDGELVASYVKVFQTTRPNWKNTITFPDYDGDRPLK